MRKVREGAGGQEPLIRKLTAGKRPYEHFPHYKTFAERWWKLRIIDLNEQQVNALAHLTAWQVLRGAEKIGTSLGLPAPSGAAYPDPDRAHDVPARGAGRAL